MTKFTTILLAGLLLISYHGYTQETPETVDYFDRPIVYEVGVSIGPMNSLTDLGGNAGIGTRGLKDFRLKNTTFSGGIYGRLFYKNFGLRLEATRGRAKGNDADLESVKASTIERFTRNLSFRSNITEVNLIAELYPLSIFGNSGPVYHEYALSPYLLFGVGFFHFNPQAKLNSQWIDLEPLHTEGEGFAEYPGRKPYSRTELDIPLGFGGRYQFSEKFNASLEFVFRKLFTDYLDDVSTTYINPTVFSKYLTGTDLQNALELNNRSLPDPRHQDRRSYTTGDGRGNSTRNDHYFSMNIKVGYVFDYKKAKE
jgi:hypothetical protein